MAYAAKNLSVLAYANGFTLWHYTTSETAATIEGAGYFNSAHDMVRPGDMMLANTSTGTTPVGDIYTVSANTGGVVSLVKLV
ncbi:MAG: hypothetical protein GC191_05725 [Azospirillum sp.]|nr:hypothetical protein [Azospirillum sp.]